MTWDLLIQQREKSCEGNVLKGWNVWKSFPHSSLYSLWNSPNTRGASLDEIWWWRVFWPAQSRRWARNSRSARKPDRQTEKVMDKPGPDCQTGGGQRPLPSNAGVTTHIVQQLLQVLLQLAEVHAGNQAFPRFGQAVPGQLSYLVVDKAEDPIGQRQNVLWGVVLDELCQPLLHLRRCLNEQKTVVNGPVVSMKIIKWHIFQMPCLLEDNLIPRLLLCRL